MFVITVVPLRRGISIETLSYFSSEAYPEGTVVTIPVRNATALGLVTQSEEVSTAKTALKAATFSLRRLPSQQNSYRLGEAYIKTATKLSDYYAVPMGMILYNLLPPEIRDGEIPLPHTHHLTYTDVHPPTILQAAKEDRFRAYRSLVRETFAHCGSVLLVVPSTIEATTLKDALEQGISDRIILLTTASTKSELRRAYAALEDFTKTKLIITTPSHALLERHDITQVIIEHARSSYYKEQARPFLDYRDVLKVHATYTGRKTLFADLLVRTEEEALRREEVYHTYGETPRRVELPARLECISLGVKGDSEPRFKLFSDETLSAIRDTKKRKGFIFLFAPRRGLAPLVTCMDCGFIFRSPESGSPYSLVRTIKDGVEERWFVCGTSGERIRAKDICENCGSWKLKEYGIGIQQVYDELHKILPDIPVTLFDHMTARTFKKAQFLRDTFYKTKGSILLGTPMAIPYLTEGVDLSVVVNMDALLSTPTWRLEEENLALLLTLREISRESVLVQIRGNEHDVLTRAKQGAVEQFYTEELLLREKFSYPPSHVFIHLTWQGTPDVAKQLDTTLASLLEAYNPSLYQSPTAPAQNPIHYILIRLPREKWPDLKLVALLKTIPPSVRLMINPNKIV